MMPTAIEMYRMEDGRSRPNDLPLNRDPFFCGRTNDLVKIAKELIFHEDNQEHGDTPKFVILVGEAGVGKTSLALEFCYRYRLFLPEIHWLHGDDDILAAMQVLRGSIRPALRSGSYLVQASRSLETVVEIHPPLIVLDHIQDVEQIQDWSTVFKGMSIIVTSRVIEWPEDFKPHVLSLEGLSLPDSVEMIHKRAGWDAHQSKDELASLATLLECHPMALRLAGTTLAGKSEGELPSYTIALKNEGRLFRENEEGLPGNSAVGWKMPLGWTVFSEYRNILNDVEGHPFHQRLLAACGFCAPFAPLPIPLLSAALGLDAEICRKALKTLIGFGFLEEGRDGVIILETMAEYARDLDLFEGWGTLDRIIQAWDERVCASTDQTIFPLDAEACTHLRCLAQIGERNRTLRIGSLWYSLAHHTQEMGCYLQAENDFLHALYNDIAEYGEEHIRVAIVYYHLGNLAHIQGDLVKAVCNYEFALDIFQALLLSTDPLIVYTASKLDQLKQNT